MQVTSYANFFFLDFFLPVSLLLLCLVAVCMCFRRVRLLWGIVVRGLHVETFVRVLRSSRVNLNKCKKYKRVLLCLDRKSFYSIFVVAFKSVLQKQCRFTKCSF